MGAGESAWPGAYYKDSLSRGRRSDRGRPSLLQCHVADESLDGMNANRFVVFFAVAVRFAGVVADTSMDGRHWIVADNHFPRFLVFAFRCESQPALNILTGRTGIVAGWH